MENLQVETIRISPHHRAIKPWSLQQIINSMEAHGYNTAYPIVVDGKGELVDGRHRLEAAKARGIDEIPCILKPEGLSSIGFGLQCNSDGQLCQENDVFDYAELCYTLSQEDWTGQQIAEELGWSDSNVSQHKQIKERLHPGVWQLARFTRNGNVVNAENWNVVNQEFTIVNWSESHFRALLKHLPYNEGDRAVMRAQVKAIRACIARATEKDKRFGQTQKQLTATWIGQLARKLAWHVKLAKHMRDNLVERVKLRDRIDLLKNVYAGVWGNKPDEKPDEKNWEKFDRAVKDLNEKALGVRLYHNDALQQLPLLEESSVSLVVTDPPYNVTNHPWDKIGTDVDYLEFTSNWLSTLRPKLREDYHLFFFCDPDYTARIETLLLENDWPLLSRIIWWNRSLPSGRNASDKFVSTWQMVFHCGTHSLNWQPEWSDERFDVQQYAAPNSSMKDGGYHPTPKPEKLLELFIKIGSKPMDVVLDMFAGGGSMGAACATVKQRQCILIEANEEFCSNIEKRLKIAREKA